MPDGSHVPVRLLHEGGTQTRPHDDAWLREQVDALQTYWRERSRLLIRASLAGWGLSGLLMSYVYSHLPGPHELAWLLSCLCGGLALYAWYNARLAKTFSRMTPDDV